MSDAEAAVVAEIKLEHLGLSGMTMILGAAWERRPVKLTMEAEGAMQRRAMLPSCQAAPDMKLAA